MSEIVVAIVALLAALAGGVFFGRRGTKTRDRARRAEDALDRVQKGQAAVNEGRATGTPDERLRRNDGSW